MAENSVSWSMREHTPTKIDKRDGRETKEKVEESCAAKDKGSSATQ